MTKNDDLYNLIDTMGTAARINRLKVASYFIDNPHRIAELILLVFDIEYKNHHKAAWVLEFVLEEHLVWLLPNITIFTNGLATLHNDSAIRPVAKICHWLAYAYVLKNESDIINALSSKHIEKIVEAGFDWMIGDYRVASKVYTMDTLYYFGLLPNSKFSWIHPELSAILAQQINSGSTGYQSHGKKILKLLN